MSSGSDGPVGNIRPDEGGLSYPARMNRIRALWAPSWHNQDWPLKVGERGTFPFFGPDAQLAPGYDLRFEYDLDPDDDYRRATVEAIEHPQFGALAEVDTRAFGQYTFLLRDGRWAVVEAEQGVGVVLSASPDFPIGESAPGRDRRQRWDLDVVLSDLAVSSHDEARSPAPGASVTHLRHE
jgi:hypothetical protein